MVYDQPNNEYFFNTIKRLRQNPSPAITGTIKGLSQIKLCK